MRTIGDLLMLLMVTASASAEVTIPVVGRPTPFINAAGSPMTATASVDTTTPVTDAPITYTLTLGGLSNAADVERPTLADFDADFRVTDPGEGAVTATSRAFRYTLLPRRPTVTTIPELAIHYYDPRIKQPTDQPRLPFRIARTTAITIAIREPVMSPRVAVPLDVPPFAESLANDSDEVSAAWWRLAIVAPPGIAVAVCAVGWYFRPAGVRLLRRRRSRAARVALGRLQDAEADSVIDTLGRYLMDRFDLTAPPRTFQEAETSTLPDEIRKETMAFLHLADAERFAPSRADARALAEAARRLVLRIEELA